MNIHVMRHFCLYIPVLLVLSACSINKVAVNAVSDALTGEGGSAVFTGDSDPELVGDALHFAIKMYEALLDQNPGHRGLILTTGSLFIMYANVFVQGPAEFLPAVQFQDRQDAIARAKNLYLRGADIISRGIEQKYPGFAGAGDRLPSILSKMKKEDTAFLYWTAAGYLSAFSLDPFDSSLGLRVPDLLRYVDRAYEIDPGFNSGALDEFYLLAYSSLPATMGGDPEKAEIHFKKALEKSEGKLAGPYVSYAQSVSIPRQDYNSFKSCLEAALAINPDDDPPNRLVNILSRRKAKKLLDMTSDYFFMENGEWDEKAYEDDDYEHE
jgi:predicted anti-sigma-YlaC factor YlaD